MTLRWEYVYVCRVCLHRWIHWWTRDELQLTCCPNPHRYGPDFEHDVVIHSRTELRARTAA